MNINVTAIKAFGGKAMAKLSKISPELALAGGIACGIGAIIAGCFASRHVDDVIAETHAELDDIQEYAAEDKIENPRKEAFRVYTKATWKLVKLYGPTVALSGASIGLILASHGILSKRYVGVSTAYSALDSAFKAYRKRVAEVLGEDAEKILAAGGRTEKNIKVLNDDDSIETIKGNSVVMSNSAKSPYEFDFNRYTAEEWKSTPDFNKAFLLGQQNYFNDIFKLRGHVFMNEVLDALGMARTPAGAICGWVRGAGDDYIDFGFLEGFTRDYNTDSDLCRKNIHLNFNCDGQIWDMI